MSAEEQTAAASGRSLGSGPGLAASFRSRAAGAKHESARPDPA